MIMTSYEAAKIHSKAYRLLRSYIATQLKPFHISYPEWATLYHLHTTPDIRGTDLARELGVEIPMVTMLLHQLEEKKLITRKANTEDKRSRVITVTSKGVALYEEVTTLLKSTLPDYFSDITIEDLKAHVRVLQKIIEKHS